jgi:hypothetical protein
VRQKGASVADRPSWKGDSGSFLYIFRTTGHRCPRKRIRKNGRSIHTYQPRESAVASSDPSNCNFRKPYIDSADNGDTVLSVFSERTNYRKVSGIAAGAASRSRCASEATKLFLSATFSSTRLPVGRRVAPFRQPHLTGYRYRARRCDGPYRGRLQGLLIRQTHRPW